MLIYLRGGGGLKSLGTPPPGVNPWRAGVYVHVCKHFLNSIYLVCTFVRMSTGTDATHAEHIETIKARAYVGVQTDGRFVPGELGIGLVEGQQWNVHNVVRVRMYKMKNSKPS